MQDAAKIRPEDAEGARGWELPTLSERLGPEPTQSAGFQPQRPQVEADLGSCPWVPGPGAAALDNPPAEGEAGVQITAGSQAAAWWVWHPPAGFGCGPAMRQL